MTKDELIEELENLAIRFSKGWHEGIKIDASDIMLFNQIAEALAQTQEPVGFAGLKIWVGDQQVVKLITLTELNCADDAWRPFEQAAEMCIATLKGKNT